MKFGDQVVYIDYTTYDITRDPASYKTFQVYQNKFIFSIGNSINKWIITRLNETSSTGQIVQFRSYGHK